MPGNMMLDWHETAQNILFEANELFYEKGYEHASMREIAKRVGISKAALYHHFENKEEILFTMCVYGGELMSGTLKTAISENEQSQAPFYEQLTDIMFRYTQSFLQNKNFNKIMLYDIESLPLEKKKVVHGYHRENQNQLKSFLQRMIDKGNIRSCNVTILTFNLFSSMHWLYFWFRPQGELSLHSVVESIADMFWLGLKPRSY